MSLKMILNKQTDFTGEFPAEYAASGLWRFNESAPDEDTALADSSGYGRNFTVVNWSGTTANLSKSPKGRQIRFNINNPTTEKTHLQVTNDGTIFANLGERIIVGGWMFLPLFRRQYILSDFQYPLRSGTADFLSVSVFRQAENYAL